MDHTSDHHVDPTVDPAADGRHLAAIREETARILREAIGRTGTVALLDAPNQRNVGDSLIWAGEVAYLRTLGLDLAYVADIWGWVPEDLRARMPSGTILIHGGGNFGDLWQGHQLHRERILETFPDYRIVQLPQSIWFESEDNAARADQAMARHPDFRALLRDHDSMARAAQQLPALSTTFCYDMALGYEPPRRARRTSRGRAAGEAPFVLVLARADKESHSHLADADEAWLPGQDTHATDWRNEGATLVAWRVCRRVALLHSRYAHARRERRVRRVWGADRASGWVLTAINRLNIRGGEALYAGASIAVVDRLHAHVLAGLLEIPHVLLDNNYGKLGAVFRDYTGRLSTAHYARDVAEARRLVTEVAAGGRD